MKHVIIGDIHGRTNWKQIVEKEKDADKFIFLGDYFDPYNWTLTLDDLVNNFDDIVKFKSDNPNKVILLIGNHDLAAFDTNANKCRYIDGTYEQVATIFFYGIKKNIFQLCYCINNKVICSHAGFSKIWLENNNLILNEVILNDRFRQSVLNKTVVKDYDFSYGDGSIWPDMSGDNTWQSPLWIRPASLLKSTPEGIIQVIGHTRIRKNSPQDVEKILLADCLEHNEYYSYENNEFKFNKL